MGLAGTVAVSTGSGEATLRRSLSRPRTVLRRAETRALRAIQEALARPHVIGPARGMSHLGEHALSWLAIGSVGIAVSAGQRREEWVQATGSVFAAHAGAVLLKRVVRRPRPDDPMIRVLVDTPSRLSFPSAHVTSTTAAMVAYGPLLTAGRVGPTAVAAAMAASRLVLGVHFPSDVAVGALAGWAVGVALRRSRA